MPEKNNLCPSCKKALLQKLKEEEERATAYDSDSQGSQLSEASQVSSAVSHCSELDPELQISSARANVNNILIALDQPPLNLHGIKHEQKLKYVNDTHTAASVELKEKIRVAVQADIQQGDERGEDDESTDEELANDMIKLMKTIQQQIKTDITYPSKVQLLTLVPESWSLRKTASYFDVPLYMVKKAFDLRNSNGILALPTKYRRQRLDAATLEAINQFYHDEEYSREMPGKKDCVTVKGDSQPHQKRLILCKLEELYRLFKEKHTAMKVSLSKFCQLRPKWCILVGPKGTHSVCTCIQHENAKLLASNTQFDYKVSTYISLPNLPPPLPDKSIIIGVSGRNESVLPNRIFVM